MADAVNGLAHGARRGVAPVGRELPHSIEAEEYLLSCCLLDGAEVIRRCVEAGVGPASFYDAKHRIIFERLLDLDGRQVPIDVSVLAEDLKTAKQLDAVGGYAFLVQVSSRIPTTAQVGYFIDKVREQALLRDIVRAATGAVEDCYNFSGGIDEFRARVEERMLGATRDVGGRLGLPPILGWDAFVAERPRVLPPELVAGVLHRGAKLMVAGGSKSFKTWVLLDLALSVASGTPWWGMRTQAGRVLYLNMELMVEFCEQRVRAISKAKRIERCENFESWHLRGHARDLAELIPHFLRRAGVGRYALIILDPIYKVLGERDENANGEVAELLNEIESLAVRSGAAVAYGHHFSKGDQSNKSAKDRASGAGAWARDPDALIALTAHEQEDHFVAEFDLRNLPQRKPFVVQWEFPCMVLREGEDPAALRKPGAPKKHELADVLVLLGDEPMRFASWERAAEKAGIGPSTFKRLRNLAVEKKAVEEVGGWYRRMNVNTGGPA